MLDSTVDPKGVWYKANLAQNLAFERRHRDFLAWTAKHNAVYRLGRTVKETSFAYYSMRHRLAARAAGGKVGASELDDLFTLGGYANQMWPSLAGAWSRYVRQGDVQGLVEVWKQHGQNSAEDENGYAVYLGVQCTDASWPRTWTTWRTDMARLHRVAPFLTWPNAWYNAPCAFWATPAGTPVTLRAARELPPILMIQSRRDAATPYEGAVNMRGLFPSARMLVVPGGNHGVALGGDSCVDQHLFRYLEDGSLPSARANCPGVPEPTPMARMAAGDAPHLRLMEALGRR
ncbi:hypothetical protein GCM10020219_091680 [Nonomuraea dietziae]